MGKWSQKKEIANGRRQEKHLFYLKSAAKQCIISVLKTRSKNTSLLTKQRNFNRRIVVRYFSNIIKVPFWPSFEDFRPRTKTSKCIISETENWRQNCCHLLVLCFVITYEEISSLYSLFVFWRWEYHDRYCRDSVNQIFVPKKKVQQSSRNVLQKTWVSHYEIHWYFFSPDIMKIKFLATSKTLREVELE